MSDIDVLEKGPIVFVRAGDVFASSRDVAEFFGKQHGHVLRDIDNLLNSEPSLRLSYFGETLSERPNPSGGAPIKSRSFEMDRDGFTLLAMGFTGKEALKWKLAYIRAFNAMEQELQIRDSECVPHKEDKHLPRNRDGKLWGVKVEKINAAARFIGVAGRYYGPEAARALWEADDSLPDLRGKSLTVLCGSAEDDPVGCFLHLMRAAAGNGRSLGERVFAAFADPVEVGKVKQFGILVGPVSASNFVAFANQHPFLARHYADTQWVGEWNAALAQLSGAAPSKRYMHFGPVKSKAVLLPRSEVLKLLDK